MPKGVPLEFPRFDGTNSVAWVFKSTQIFKYYQTPGPQKLTMAINHMEGEALV